MLESKDSIVVIFNLRIESSEGVIQIKIELNKKEKENSKEELINLLNRKIYKLDKELENIKKDNEIKLKKKDEQINILNKKIEQLEKQFINKIKAREIELNKIIEDKDKK